MLTNDADAIAFINRARPGTWDFSQFMGKMSRGYNGQPFGSAGYYDKIAVYTAAANDLVAEMGEAYWRPLRDLEREAAACSAPGQVFADLSQVIRPYVCSRRPTTDWNTSLSLAEWPYQYRAVKASPPLGVTCLGVTGCPLKNVPANPGNPWRADCSGTRRAAVGDLYRGMTVQQCWACARDLGWTEMDAAVCDAKAIPH